MQRGAQLAVNLRRVAVKVGDGQWLKKLRQRLQVGPRAALGNAEYDSATVMDDRPKPVDSCVRKAASTSGGRCLMAWMQKLVSSMKRIAAAWSLQRLALIGRAGLQAVRERVKLV